MGRAANDDELRLSSSQLRQLLDFIKAQRQIALNQINVSYACEGFLGPYEQEVRDSFFYCRAGVEVASILCDGSISGCTSIRSNLAQGNIYSDDFWQVWQSRFQLYRARKGQCASCKVWRYCEGSGLHLYDENRQLMYCHYHQLK